MSPMQGSVDIHAHLFPDKLPDFAARTGDSRWPWLSRSPGEAVIVREGEVYREIEESYWAVGPRMEWMDRAGIQWQVVSPLPVLLTYWAEPDLAADYSRHVNEGISSFVDQRPDRLIGFGTVPLQDVSMAVQTLEEVRALGLRGVEIGSHVGSTELNSRKLRPFFEAAAAMGMPILLHPLEGIGLGRLDNGSVRLGMGVPADTGISCGYLMLSGLLSDLPDLRLCLSHGGGSFFWALPRMRGIVRAHMGTEASERLSAAMRAVFVDTAGLDADNIAYLVRKLGPEKVVLGSDFPAARAVPPLSWLDAMWDGDQGPRIVSTNPQEFLFHGTTK